MTYEAFLAALKNLITGKKKTDVVQALLHTELRKFVIQLFKDKKETEAVVKLLIDNMFDSIDEILKEISNIPSSSSIVQAAVLPLVTEPSFINFKVELVKAKVIAQYENELKELESSLVLTDDFFNTKPSFEPNSSPLKTKTPPRLSPKEELLDLISSSPEKAVQAIQSGKFDSLLMSSQSLNDSKYNYIYNPSEYLSDKIIAANSQPLLIALTERSALLCKNNKNKNESPILLQEMVNECFDKIMARKGQYEIQLENLKDILKILIANHYQGSLLTHFKELAEIPANNKDYDFIRIAFLSFLTLDELKKLVKDKANSEVISVAILNRVFAEKKKTDPKEYAEFQMYCLLEFIKQDERNGKKCPTDNLKSIMEYYITTAQLSLTDPSPCVQMLYAINPDLFLATLVEALRSNQKFDFRKEKFETSRLGRVVHNLNLEQFTDLNKKAKAARSEPTIARISDGIDSEYVKYSITSREERDEERRLESEKSYRNLDIINEFTKSQARLKQKIESQKDEKKSDVAPIETTDSIFGHVHNDHALTGTKLVGNIFSNTIDYLQQILHKITYDPDISATAKEDIEKIQNEFKATQHVADLLYYFRTHLYNYQERDRHFEKDYKSSRPPIDTALNKVGEHLAAICTKNKGVLLPGGWSTKEGGHAMLYEIKQVKGKYYLLIHNTGGGITNHAKQETEQNTYYSSVKAYEIPDPVMQGKGLSSLLKVLVRPEIDAPSSYDESELYKEIGEVTNKLGMKPIEHTFINSWTLSQQSGTCSWRVLASYLKNYPYQQGVEYQDIRFEVKLTSLEAYYLQNKQAGRLGNTVVAQQLNFAIQNFALIVTELTHSVPPLSDKKIKQCVELINHIKTDLTAEARKTPWRDLPAYQINEEEKLAEKLIPQDSKIHGLLSLNLEPVNMQAKSIELKMPAIELIKFNEKDPVQSLQQLLGYIEKNQKIPREILKAVETFYLSIPIPSTDYFNHLTPSDLKTFISTISLCNVYYARAAAKISLYPFADQAIILNTGRKLAEAAASKKSDSGVWENITNYNTELSHKYHHSAYFIYCNPIYASQVKNLARMPSTPQHSEEKLSKAFHPIILKYKDNLLPLLGDDKSFMRYIEEYPMSWSEALVSFGLQYLAEELKGSRKLPDQPWVAELKNDLTIALQLHQSNTILNDFYSGKKEALLTLPPKDIYEHFLTNYENVLAKAHGQLHCQIKWSVDKPSTLEYAQHYTQPELKGFYKENVNNRVPNSNIIYTSGTADNPTLTEEVALKRTLDMSRLNPMTQCAITLDILKKQMMRAEDPQFQTYIFMNLFESNLLLEQIKRSPAFIKELTETISRGFSLFAKSKQMSPTLLFFTKLAYGLQEVLQTLPDHVAEKTELNKQQYKIIQSAINYYTKQIPSKERDSMLRQLYSFQLLNIKQSDPKTWHDTTYLNILHCSFYRKLHLTFVFDDAYIEHQADKATHALIKPTWDYVEKLSIGQRTQLLNQLAQQLGIDIPPNCKWQLEYPLFTLVDSDKQEKIKLDILNGRVNVEKFGLTPLPAEVVNNPLFLQFFPTTSIKALANADFSIYEFIYNNVKYRFSVSPNHLDAHPNGILYREIEFNGAKQWYQYEPQTPIHQISNTLIELGKKCWVNCEEKENPNVVIIEQASQNIVGFYDAAKQEFSQVENNKPSSMKLINAIASNFLDRNPFFKNFESPDLIEVWRDEKEGSTLVKMPRYNLSFKTDGKSSPPVWIWQEDPRYQISNTSSSTIIIDFNHPMILSPAQGEKVPDIALFPKQSFILAENTRESLATYDVALDISRKAMNTTLGNKDIFSTKDLSADKYRFSQSEKFICYAIKNNHDLIPATREDAFYLAYVYLAKNQPLLAYKTLQDTLKHQAPMTLSEIELLRKIMKETPLSFGSWFYRAVQAQEEKAHMETPEIEAVRLLAASILTEQQQKGLILKTDPIPTSPIRNANAEYQKINQNKTMDFFNNKDEFYQAIKECYLAYRKKERNIPHYMRISQDRELKMLKNIRPRPGDAKREVPAERLPIEIEGRRKKLSKSKLLREKHLLEQAEKRSRAMEARLRKINTKLLKYKIVTADKEKPQKEQTIKAISDKALPSNLSLFQKKSATKSIKLLPEQPLSFANEADRLKLNVILEKERKLDKQATTVTLSLKQDSKEAIVTTLYTETITDYKEGAKKNLAKQTENSALEKLILEQTPEGREKQINDLIKLNTFEKNELETLKTALLKLANTAPKDPKEKAIFELEKAALQRSDLKFEDLLHLFLMQDLKLFQKPTTYLNDKEIEELNQGMLQYLLKATQVQYHERYCQLLQKLQEPDLTIEQKVSVQNQLGSLLASKRCYEPHLHPDILVFEYLDNKMVFPEQFKYLSDLVKNENGKFNSQAIQLIMGGGKSKVLLPLLALKKATGTNLSIIEVPEALFAVNQADLIKTTETLFGQKGHAFTFNSQTPCTVEFFKNLRRDLRSIMVNREYIITTKESLQSLELQLIRLIQAVNPEDPSTLKQVKYLSDIIRMIKYQGDAIIDEIDSTLDVRKQLIYTAGAGQPLTKDESKTLFALFDFFKDVNVGTTTLDKVASGEQSVSQEKLLNLLNELAKQLIYSEKSPINALCNDLNAQQANEFIQYLTNKTKSAPSFIAGWSDQNKNIIAFYREEITDILPLTLSKQRNEHFGLTRDPNKKELDREVAIPYLASDTPNERSKFGNYLEAVNYTFQVQLIKPLSLEMTSLLLRKFKDQAVEELKYNLVNDPEKSAHAQFKKVTGLDLDDINTDDASAILEFHHKVYENKTVKEFCLTEYIIPHIEKNSKVLASDAQNHASQFRSVQGMTGTDWNYRCFSAEIKRNQEVSFGSDGQTLHHLLRKPKICHLLKETASPKELFAKTIKPLLLEHKHPKTLHSWIDLGAHCKGLSNLDIAKSLATFFKETKNFAHLNYVLYFGADDKLYALPTAGGDAIVLDNTDPEYIQGKLGGDSSTYFTYYDQRRTTGTDIKQTLDAHAFVTLGVGTLERDLLQAVNRLRDLKNSQQVEFVIPKHVQTAYPHITDWSVETVIQLTIDNQIKRLAEDHFRSATQKMKNILRNNVWERVLAVEDPVKQAELLNKFERVFYTLYTQTPFQEFGGVKDKAKIKVVLEDLAKDVMANWLDLTKGMRSEEEIAQFKKLLDDVVKDSVGICFSEVDTLKSAGVQMQDTQVEIEQQTQQELQRETDCRMERNVTPLVPPPLSPLKSDWQLIPGKDIAGIKMNPLNDVLEECQPKPSFKFDNHILMSEHFRKTSPKPEGSISPYSKGDTFILMVSDATMGFKALMLTPEEAAHLVQEFEKNPQAPTWWIESTHQTVFAGKKPDTTHLPANYQETMDQLAFFSADTDLLAKSHRTASWTCEKFNDKMVFLEKNLMPLHREKVNCLKPLKEKHNNLGLQKFSQYAANDTRFEETKPLPGRQFKN